MQDLDLGTQGSEMTPHHTVKNTQNPLYFDTPVPFFAKSSEPPNLTHLSPMGLTKNFRHTQNYKTTKTLFWGQDLFVELTDCSRAPKAQKNTNLSSILMILLSEIVFLTCRIAKFSACGGPIFIYIC